MSGSSPYRYGPTERLDVVLVVAGMVLSGVLTIAAAKSPLVTFSILGALGLAALAYLLPQSAIAVWLVITILVPFWTPVMVQGVNFPPSAAVAGPVIIGCLLSPKTVRPKLTWVDGCVAAFAAIVLFLYFTREIQGLFFLRDIFTLWLCAYVIGRLATPQTLRWFPVLMLVVAAWGMIEFVTGWHFFENWFALQSGNSSKIMERDGLARSEATFGHPIAMGAACVMAIPFAAKMRYPIVAQMILAGGVLSSLSRGPILALALSALLTVWTVAPAKKRMPMAVLAGSLGVGGYFLLRRLYSGDAAPELESSSNTRANQLTLVEDQLRWFHSAISGYVDGRPVVGTVSVIDNAPLRIAANFGILALLFIAVPFIVAGVLSILRKTGPAGTAIAGQIPVLLFTSFIQQWQVLLFFILGAFATELSRRHMRTDEFVPPSPERETAPRCAQPGSGKERLNSR